MPTTTKQHLARYLVEHLHMRNGQAKMCVDTLFEALSEAIIQDNRIEI